MDSPDPSSVEPLWTQLTHNSKLERDKGLEQMNTLFGDDQDARRQDQEQMTKYIVDYARDKKWDECQQWETKIGFLTGASLLYCHSKQAEAAMAQGVPELFSAACLALLTDDEVRVRGAAADLLGNLCQVHPAMYDLSKSHVLGLVKDNLDRQHSEAAVAAAKDSRKTAEAILHDTAGWKHLETSMMAVRRMVEGLGNRFPSTDLPELMQLVRTSLSHQNRFVRETGYYTLISFIETGSFDAAQFGDQFADAIGVGLSDNWSQVRLAATISCRHFLEAFADRREDYYPLLLPRLCLNRYYMAEGVRLYCQETWRRVIGAEGRALVQKYLEQVVTYYVDCTMADNHAVREAACHCIAELAVKLEKSALSSHVTGLLDTLIVCFQDDSWPVRDTACVAAGRFVRAFPEESKPRVDELWPLFVGNIKDPIASVRQGAAQALSNVVMAYTTSEQQEHFARALELVREGLKGLRDQPEESHRYTDLSAGVTTFGVAKKLRDNDVELHENQPMFSCGSLAPKMGRGGGCSDSRFKKPSEPWEFADGTVHLFAELCLTLPAAFHGKLHPLLVPVSDSLRVRHFTMHMAYAETIWKRLAGVGKALGKRNFKPYLEEFMDSLFYAAEGENALARSAAESFLHFLNDYLGPNILRGRVELVGTKHLLTLERVLIEPMSVDGPVMGVAIPTRGEVRDEPELGGSL